MSAPNYWTSLRHDKISRRTMLGASAKAGVGAAGLALVGCGGDDDDDGAGDAAAAEAAAAAGDSSAAAAAAERAAAAAEAAAAAAAAAGDAGAAAVAEAAAAAAEAAAAEAAREAGADQAQAAAEAAAAAAAAAEDAAQAAREAADAATAGAGDGEAATAGYDLNAKLRIAFGAFTSTLDPHTQAGFGGHAAANLLHFDTVFARGFDGLARNGGTFDFEFVDANEKLLLTQNPGWTYQDGTPVTLEEVQFNIERTGGRWAGDPNFVGRAGNLVGIEDIAMVDATAGKLSMDPPSPGVPNILVRLLLTPRAHVEALGAGGMANSPIGHGPFQFTDWTPDQVINSTRFDGYGNGRDFDHMKRLPWVKDLESRLFPEEQARLAALENNEIDIATQIIPDLARTYEDDPDFVVWYHSAQRGLHIQIPKHLLEDPVNGGPNPWRDLRVRAAANLAVNQDVLINNIMTGRENRTYTLAVGQAGHDGAEGPISDLDWGYDPDRARALLAEAGYPGRLRLRDPLSAGALHQRGLVHPGGGRDAHGGGDSHQGGDPGDSRSTSPTCARTPPTSSSSSRRPRGWTRWSRLPRTHGATRSSLTGSKSSATRTPSTRSRTTSMPPRRNSTRTSATTCSTRARDATTSRRPGSTSSSWCSLRSPAATWSGRSSRRSHRSSSSGTCERGRSRVL